MTMSICQYLSQYLSFEHDINLDINKPRLQHFVLILETYEFCKAKSICLTRVKFSDAMLAKDISKKPKN